jgi:DNA-binding transcriptional ArsR family regulator
VGGERLPDSLAVGEIAAQFSVGFSAVSQHLGVLRQAGLVTVRRDGTRRLYRADQAALGRLGQVLEQMWSRQLDELTEGGGAGAAMNEPRLVIERRIAASPTRVFSVFASPSAGCAGRVSRRWSSRGLAGCSGTTGS